ncbi:MAG: lactococcin 972 family bacteriocin [Oscillospiraceae bacterium]|nr:lactococcin 972 family bacteriocin [Oscillospiraceae bacterium]
MKKLKNLAISTLAVGLMTISAISVVSATTANPEGGTWVYGTSGIPGIGKCYSEFWHPSRTHSATAVNGSGKVDKDFGRPSNVWAKASVSRSFSGNEAYYGFD